MASMTSLISPHARLSPPSLISTSHRIRASLVAQPPASAPSDLVSSILSKVKGTDRGVLLSKEGHSEVAAVAQQLRKYCVDEPVKCPLIFGEWDVVYCSRPTSPGGGYRSVIGRLIFKTNEMIQIVEAPVSVRNKVSFSVFGFLEGEVSLKGKLKVLDDKWIEVIFEPPQLKIGALGFQYGWESDVKLEISYIDENIRLGKGSKAIRAQFLIECLMDLKNNLMKKGLDLLIQHGKPEEILPTVVKATGAHTVYAHKETCSEEVFVERLVHKGLQQVVLSVGSSNQKPLNPKLQLIWGSTLYHIDDLNFDANNLPDVYTQFRKSVESKCSIRVCCKLPLSLGPCPSNGLDEIGGWGTIPSLEQLGVHERTQCDKGMHFVGGESAALGRLHDYFWKKDLLKVYKETRNGMLGPDFSTKFAPWLASGSLSPRYVYEEVKRYEKERLANDSTYWVLFELIWRDYFRFLSIKYGNSIFHIGGPRKIMSKWSQDQSLFESWRDGRTGYPLIDANMKELSTTGFMSNRGRQIVCSFLVRDMGIDWRMGAEWFETCLLDYDPCSNYGNWTYGAGVGNDPREDRYFSIPKQAKTYDPDGEYVAYWLPELQSIPKEIRHFPGNSYIKQIVPLKFGSPSLRPNLDNTEKSRHRSQRRR